MRSRALGYLHPGGVQAERGASAVIVAITMVAMLSVGAITIDYGEASLTKRQTQNAADSLATAIAERCAAQSMSASCLQTAATANNALLTGNAPAGRVQSVDRVDDRTVRVRVTKDVDYRFAQLLGGGSGPDGDTVLSSATARADVVPVRGMPVLPLGVGYCTWKNRSGAAGTSTESNSANRVNLRTDTLQGLRNALGPVEDSVRTVLEIDGLMNNLGTEHTDTCTDDDSGRQLANFRGATWLHGEHVLNGVGTSLFGWDAGNCQLNISRDFTTFLGGVQGSAIFPPSCASKLGTNNNDKKMVTVGKTILLPVYKPRSDLQNRYGFKVQACVGLGTRLPNPMCLEVPPKIGVEVIGFAPFHVTGWDFERGAKRVDQSLPAGQKCTKDDTITLDPYNIARSTFRLLEALTQAVLNLLTITDPKVTITCYGLHGYFTKSMVRDTDFAYGTGGVNLGAGQVRLVE